MENNQQTLYELMANYDFDNSGTINIQDLVRAFKKLGMLHPEPHLPILMAAGGASPDDERVDYVVYTQALESAI
jgi:Ca2+-binding EF-hand superfamily protein